MSKYFGFCELSTFYNQPLFILIPEINASQKKQEEEYKKWKRSQGRAEDLFAKELGAARRKNLFERKCSVCGNPQAWRSSDFGRTWQCFAHAKD